LAITTFAQPGALDLSFNPGTGTDNVVYASAILSDGKILIGGVFTTYNGLVKRSIARLYTDATLDTLFDPGTGANGVIRAISVQNDDKIIINGQFTNYNGVSRKYIARLNDDGSLDPSFNVGSGANDFVHTNALQSDGRILIGGQFTSYNGTARNRIARLNQNGTLDTTFNPGTGVSFSSLYAIQILNDGKIIIGGTFSSYNGTPINNIARLNANGTLDTTFNVGTGVGGYVTSISLQSDGKIIVGGDFSNYNGIPMKNIARLNSDGTLDSTFIMQGSGLNSSLLSTSIQSDGKIIIGGYFSNFNGISRNKIARLNMDGTLDLNFIPGTGASSNIQTTCIQSDGQIIIGGQFNSYNGTTRNRIARVQNDGIVNISSMTHLDANIKFFPNPTNGEFTIQADDLIDASLSVYNSTGQLIIQQKNISGNNITIDLNNQANGLFIVELIQKSKSKRFKIAKQ